MQGKTIAFTVDEEFHREIKIRLAETGQTLKGYLINLIRVDLDTNPQKEEYSLKDIKEKADEIIRIVNSLAENKK